MSQGIEPEAIQPPTPRRGKWGRRIFRGCLVFLALLVLFHQLLLTHALRLVAIRLAAGENIQLSLEVEGSVWTYLTLKNVRAVSTGTSPVDTIRIEWLRVEYNLLTLLRQGPREFLTFYNLRNANLVLDSVKGNEDQKHKLAQVLRDILQQPAMYSDRAQIENFNLTLRATEGDYYVNGVHALLDPVKKGYIRVGELTIPNIGSWKDLHTEATYMNRHLVLRDFSLGDEVRVARLELDASRREKGVSYLSFEGTVLGGDLGLFLWQQERAAGDTQARITAYFSDMPLAALSKYAGWKVPVAGNLKEAWIQMSGDPLAPAKWDGQASADVENGTVGGFAIGEASGKLSVKNGLAKLESLQFSTGKNRLAFTAQRPLPENFDQFRLNGLEAAFTLDAPELASLHASLTGGQAKGQGRVSIENAEVAIQGNVTASGVKGKDFAVEQGNGDFEVSHSLDFSSSVVPWYEGFKGRLRVEAGALRFQEFAAKSLSLDVPITGEMARITKLALDINGKDRLDGQANVSFREPFPYEASLTGSVQNIAFFQPFLAIPLGGALEINWHGTGEIALMRHSGEGRVALQHGTLGALTGIEAELAGVYSPESIDITALKARSDQGTLQAGVRLRDQRLYIEAFRFTAEKIGTVTGNISFPLDLRTPTQRETIFPPAGALQGALVLEQIDLAKTFQVSRPGLAFRGLLSGSLTAGGTMDSPDLMAKIEAHNLQADAAAKLAPAAGDATLLFKNSQLVLSGSLAQPGLSPLLFKGEMPLSLSKVLAERRIDPSTPFTFSAKLPPSPAGLFAPFIPNVRLLEGRLSVDASATGSLEKPVFHGGIALDLPAIRFQDADLPGINHLLADLRFTGTELTFYRFTGDVAGGPFSVTGRLRLDNLTDPLFDLRLQSQGTLLVRNDTLTLRADSDLRIAGPINQAQVSGKIGITKSRFFREIEILPIGLPGRPAPKMASGSFDLSLTTPPFRNWSYDVAITTIEPFAVKGNLANGSIEGNLHLGGTGLAPTLDGTAYIENFVASLPFSRLTVDHGTLYFSSNTEPLNPRLDIHGSSRIRDYNVNVYLYGTASEPQTLFTSEPSLPQEDVIALLATGATTRDFAQNNQVLAGRAAALLARDLYRKLFPKRNAPANERNPLDHFSLDVGAVDPRTGKQELMGRLKLSNEYQFSAGVDMQGDVRMQLQYLIKFQ